MNNSFKMVIKLQSIEDGQKYFSIFEVVCIAKDGSRHIYNRCLTYEMALKNKRFVLDYLSSLYSICYINEQLVWC